MADDPQSPLGMARAYLRSYAESVGVTLEETFTENINLGDTVSFVLTRGDGSIEAHTVTGFGTEITASLESAAGEVIAQNLDITVPGQGLTVEQLFVVALIVAIFLNAFLVGQILGHADPQSELGQLVKLASSIADLFAGTLGSVVITGKIKPDDH